MTWEPEHEKQTDYTPADGMVLANDGHVHIIDRRYVAAGLREAAEYCAEEADALLANWTVLCAYVNDAEARARIDARMSGLDDAGRWRCKYGAWHGVDDGCDCKNGEN